MINFEKFKDSVICQEEGLHGGYYWPSVICDSKGRLTMVCSGGRMGHVCPFGRLMASYSYDSGNSWTAPAGILHTYSDERDGGIVETSRGFFATTFNNSLEFQRGFCSVSGWSRELQSYVNSYLDLQSEQINKNLGSLISHSTDGYQFDDPIRISITAPHGAISLANGRIFLAGRAFAHYAEDDSLYLPDGIYSIITDGDDWSDCHLIIPQGENGLSYYEPHAAQLENGGILIAMRIEKNGGISWRPNVENGLFSIATSFSNDGINFSPIIQTEIEGSPPHLLRHSSGVIIMTYGRRIAPFGQRAVISRDGGMTWSEELVLRNDGQCWDVGYPATCELCDGSLYTVYYQQGTCTRNSAIWGTHWKI